MQTDIDKTKIYQRNIEDLETRLAGHGTLIEDQHIELDDMRWKLRGAYFVAAVAIVCLLVVSYQQAAAPMPSINGVECRL